MILYDNKRHNKGFTLVEVIVTLALISILLPVIYNFFGFNLKIYSKSETLSEIQYDVRMVSDEITNNIRNALKVTFVEDHFIGAESITFTDLKIKYPNLESVKFRIKKESSALFFQYIVIGEDQKGNTYKLESEVFLNNTPEFIHDVADDLYIYHDAVYYTK